MNTSWWPWQSSTPPPVTLRSPARRPSCPPRAGWLASPPLCPRPSFSFRMTAIVGQVVGLNCSPLSGVLVQVTYIFPLFGKRSKREYQRHRQRYGGEIERKRERGLERERQGREREKYLRVNINSIIERRSMEDHPLVGLMISEERLKGSGRDKQETERVGVKWKRLTRVDRSSLDL